MSGSSKHHVLVIQHAEPEHLGGIATAFNRAEMQYSCIRADLSEPLPSSIANFAGLVVLGGPQSVVHKSSFPHLLVEEKLIESAMREGIPTLGICLGSQLIADVLGAELRSSTTMELGWKKVVATESVVEDRVLSGLPSAFTPLHWHADSYSLPFGHQSVGSSLATPIQGFFSNRVHALLFHLETTLAQIRSMAESFPDDLANADTTTEQLLSESVQRVAEMESMRDSVFVNWVRLVQSV